MTTRTWNEWGERISGKPAALSRRLSIFFTVRGESGRSGSLPAGDNWDGSDPSQGCCANVICATPPCPIRAGKRGGRSRPLPISPISNADPEGMGPELHERKEDRGKRICESPGPPFVKSTRRVPFTLPDRPRRPPLRTAETSLQKPLRLPSGVISITTWTERSSTVGCTANIDFSAAVSRQPCPVRPYPPSAVTGLVHREALRGLGSLWTLASTAE